MLAAAPGAVLAVDDDELEYLAPLSVPRRDFVLHTYSINLNTVYRPLLYIESVVTSELYEFTSSYACALCMDKAVKSEKNVLFYTHCYYCYDT